MTNWDSTLAERPAIVCRSPVRHLFRLLLLCLGLLLVGQAGAQTQDLPKMPASIGAAGDFEGKNVVRVTIKVDGHIWTKPPLVTLPEIGEPLVFEEARKELARLLAAGGFAEGSITLEAKDGGVEVGYVVVPGRYVRKLVVRGNVLGDEEMLRAAGLYDIRQVTERSLESAQQKIQDLYQKRGYPSTVAAVSTIETDKPLVVVVQVTIEPGKQATVGGRVFAGLPLWDPAAKAAAAAYEVSVGDRADEEQLDLADRNLGNALRVAGFHQAVVSHAVSTGKNGKVTVTVTVVPGSKILVSFDGAVIFDKEGLLEVLDLANETDRSPSRLASKIEAAYVRRGRLDVQVEPELLGKPGDAVRTLRLRIREGQIVTVARRVYPCLTGALDPARLDAEIDAFLEEELAAGNVTMPSSSAIDGALGKHDGVSTGARPEPEGPSPTRTFVSEAYEKAIEHIKDLFRSEGYLFVEVGEAVPSRAACDPKSSGPKSCVPLPEVTPDPKKLCQFDNNHLPLPIPLPDKKATCTPDPLKGRACSPDITVVIPINPGPRSYLWDLKLEGTKAFAPEVLLKESGARSTLKMGAPLSLRDVDLARAQLEGYYKDEGYAFASVKATFEYSPDRSRARVRFLVTEGELTIIEAIEVTGARRTSEALIRDRLLLKDGDPFKARLVRRSIELLSQLGSFSSVAIQLVNPSVPAKRKVVVVSLVERPRQSIDYRLGYSLGEGLRFVGDYQVRHLLQYAVEAKFSLRVSKQPFLGCSEGEACKLYDSELIRRWRDLPQLDQVARRLSFSLSAPHNPLLGPVRTTLELADINDLRRDFQLHRTTAILSFSYQPLDWLSFVFAGAIERNFFKQLGQETSTALIDKNPALANILRVPEGLTGVLATSVSAIADFRDNKLGATKNGYAAMQAEYVQSFLTPGENQARQQFWHLQGSGGLYFRVPFLPGKSVLAFELRGGVNMNTGSCAGQDPAVCSTYPDRLFYLGGFDSVRGFFPGQMLPQDSIDELLSNPGARLAGVPCGEIAGSTSGNPTVAIPGFPDSDCGNALVNSARRGGNVFINPRIELRLAAFKWGGIVFFVDAANTWRERSKFQPWRLRYTVGPGLSVDTPVGPIALDLGFNVSRYEEFNEPLPVFNFSIGRF